MNAGIRAPLTISNLDGRIYVIDASPRRLFEIEPGQSEGRVVTVAEKLAIAMAIIERFQ